MIPPKINYDYSEGEQGLVVMNFPRSIPISKDMESPLFLGLLEEDFLQMYRYTIWLFNIAMENHHS